MNAYRIWCTIFAAASLLLGTIIVLQLRKPPSIAHQLPAPKMSPETPENMQNPGVFNLDRVQAYAAIADRPLFSPTRKPTKRPPPPVQAKTNRQSLTNIVLTGVLISPEKRVALIRSAQSPKLQSLNEGQRVGGWRLDKVLHDRVVLSAGDDTAEISIWDKSKGRGSGGRPAPRRTANPPR